MTTVSAVRGVAVLPLILLVTACAPQDDGGAGDRPAAPAYPGDAVVLRIDHIGGFVTPAALATRLPRVTVYGDGRMITEGPVALRYPAPALPNVQVTTLDAGAVARLVERARAAGVGTADDLGTPPVTDVPTTRFALLGATGVEETTVEALDMVEAEGGLSADQRAAREKLRAFARSLTDAATGGGSATPSPYRPTAVAAVAEPWVANDEAGEQVEVAWPGPDLPGAPLGTAGDLSCVTVTGERVRQVLDAAATANAATPWASGGKRWTVTFRPLLPDEADCGDLATAR
ncbi:hypothetical protein [Micromonospora halophytica]|uniref:Uncharacterized protein n=1 Tax=Micromonospora halophytica TaxID=47864 RepID=A0A1C5HRC5_9ACTN|nr:hypothetical protein [Micromonospora halophytica]SCG48522.1 hypothetical protein GA0070560_105271 [Micromonospora halophytica]